MRAKSPRAEIAGYQLPGTWLQLQVTQVGGHRSHSTAHSMHDLYQTKDERTINDLLNIFFSYRLHV